MQRLRLLAREQVDVVVAPSGAAEDGLVGVERCCGDGRAAVLLQEARVRLETREFVALKVEDFDCMRRSTAVI